MHKNALEAAIDALQRLGKPTTGKELTTYILQNGLWINSGKTPYNSIAARIYVDLKYNENSQLAMVAPSVFVLKEWDLTREIYQNIPNLIIKVLESSSEHLSEQDIINQLIAEKLWVPSPKLMDNSAIIIATIIDSYKKSGNKPTICKDPDGRFFIKGSNNTAVDSLSVPSSNNISQELDPENSVQNNEETVQLAESTPEELPTTEKEQSVTEENIYYSNDDVKKILRDRLMDISPAAFEKLIGQLLEAMGFKAEVTNYSRDNGIDVRGELVIDDVIKVKMSVQAKRYKKGTNVSAPTVQQLRGSVRTVELERGLIITTSDFTASAYKEAESDGKTNIALMNGEKLAELLLKYEIGVKSQKVYTIDEATFTNL